MSYLLQTGRRNTKNATSSGASASRSVNLPHGGRVGGVSFRRNSDGVGGQIQTVRPPQHTHRVTPSNHRQQQQPQSNVESVLSMEEVLADLRILQDQQNEAERRLQQTRATKQKRLEQQASVEAQLDRLKYANGQQRAELQRATALLSVGQRQIAEARVKAETAGVDLREFDRKVQKCLAVKRFLHSYQRMHDAMLQVLRNMLSQLRRLVEEAKVEHEQAEADYNKAREFEYSLRKGIKTEAESQQHSAKVTVHVRVKSASAENALNVALKKEADAKRKKDRMGQNVEEHHQQSANSLTVMGAGLEQLARRKEELALKIAAAKEATNSKAQLLHTIWHRAIEIQKEERHKPSLPPSETNVPPVIDIETIRESVEAETAAAAEETKAKDELEPKVEALRLQLPNLEVELTATAKQVDELAAAKTETQKAETARSLAIFKCKTELDIVKKQVAVKEHQVQQLRAARESEVTEIQKRLNDATIKHHARDKELAIIHEENSAIDAQVTELQSALSEIQAADAETLESNKVELEEAKYRVRALATKVATAEEFACEKNYTARIVKYKHEVKRIRKGYPSLANVECKYRPDLRTRDQEAIDLRDFLKKCKTRTEAARKLIADNKAKTVDAKVPFKPTKRQPRASAQLKDAEQDKHSEQGADDRQKPGKTIRVQPRDLLCDFSQEERAQDELDQSFDSDDPRRIGETTGDNIVLDSDLEEDDSSTKSSKLQLGQFSQSQPSFTQVSHAQPDEELTLTQQSMKALKKVRWHDRSNSEDRALDQPTHSKKLVPEARRKNAAFGSNRSTASISSHSTVQTSNKATKASDARREVLAKARTLTIDPHCRKKSSSRAKIPEEMTKERSSSEGMCLREQGRRSGVEKSDIGPSSGQGRGLSNLRSGTSTEEQMGRVSSKSGAPTISSSRPAEKSRRSHSGKAQSFDPACEESKDKSTAAKKSNRHTSGNARKAHNASRSDSGRKNSHLRNDDDDSKQLLGPSKKQKTDPPAGKASRPRISKDAPKGDKSKPESTKSELNLVAPSNSHRTQKRDKWSAKAKAGDKSAPTEATKRTKHSTSTSHSTDSSRPPKPSHTTQSTGIPSQEIPRGRRRWPKAQVVAGRGKMPRMEKFVDDFNFSFE